MYGKKETQAVVESLRFSLEFRNDLKYQAYALEDFQGFLRFSSLMYSGSSKNFEFLLEERFQEEQHNRKFLDSLSKSLMSVHIADVVITSDVFDKIVHDVSVECK